MVDNKELEKGLKEIRENDKDRKFDQTVDLIINLTQFNNKKEGLNLFVQVPHKIKDKKICGFLESKNNEVDTITGQEFKKYQNDKKALKNLEKNYDFFIAQGSLMPKVATTFGRVLGPVGKMPSPQMGIILNADEKTVKELKGKINKGIKIRTKEASVKVPIGKQSMKDEELIDNINSVYSAVFNALPKNKENIKNVEIKFTMSKPYKIWIK